MFEREIVCLSISTKMGGSCVAGKDINTNEWIRPITNRDYEQINDEDMIYENKKLPELLDIIKIPFKKNKPSSYQPENILIDDEYYWELIKKYPVSKLDGLCDNPKTIFANEGFHRDRLPPEFIDKNGSKASLLLIKPDTLRIVRDDVPTEWGMKKKVRALITYNSITYDLGVTDPICKRKYLSKKTGYYNSLSAHFNLRFSVFFYKANNSIPGFVIAPRFSHVYL